MYWSIVFYCFDIFFEVLNILQKLVFLSKSFRGKKKHVEKNKNIKKVKKGERFFLVGNGPSIKDENLTNLKNENTIFMNMGYFHKDYKQVQPNYHVFVDPKLASGEWDIGILDEIIELNPKVEFFLNSKWIYLDKFQTYINDPKFKIYWIEMNMFCTRFHQYESLNLARNTYGMGALGASIAIANYLGSKEMYLLGVESNAFCNESINKKSHFYGFNKDNNNMSSEMIYQSLFFNYLYLNGMHNCAKFSGKLNIFNCTPGGILNMFKRVPFEKALSRGGVNNNEK